MPDIQLTDQLDKPVENVKVDVTRPSSLVKYLKTETLHLAVFPEFLERKDLPVSKAAPKAIQFAGKGLYKFQLGTIKPEIDVTPEMECIIRANAGAGTSLFDADPFQLTAKVPPNTGYVSIGFGGSLEVGASGSDGDLAFGFKSARTVKLEYLKAFTLGAREPSLGEALGETMSCYVIPADISDVKLLGVNDIATVSGQGSLKVSGGIKFTAIPNPLASVELLLGAGPICVKAGPVAGVSASFEISGSYQVRVHRISDDSVELSISRERGTVLKADFSASAGVAAGWQGRDLIATVLGAISTDPAKDKKELDGLQPSEIKSLADALKIGLDHSLNASLDVILSTARDDQPAFQYEIQLSKLSPDASLAVHKALDGDLSLLTAMEDGMQSGGLLAPGLRMLSSVFAETTKRGIALKINLIGILNYVTVSELIRHSEILTDEVTGDITVKETVTGNRISAITDPYQRAEAIRKAMFDSVLATTTYRAGKAVAAAGLTCEQVHFSLNQNTNQQTLTDYLNWFDALHLISPQDAAAFRESFSGGGRSTCVLRTSFTDSQCNSLFFDENGSPRQRDYYLDIGRRALGALLNPKESPNDELRCRILDDALWSTAVGIGANANLGPLVGLSTEDSRVGPLIGDMDVITSWAKAMVDAEPLIQDLRTFVGESDPTIFAHNNGFKTRCDALQKKLAAVVKTSRTRFEEPWGMVCLFWASGSHNNAYGRVSARMFTLERGTQRTFTAAGG